jgi:hypothetical protein
LIPEDFLIFIAKEHSVSNTELEVLSAALKGEPMNGISKRLGIRPEAARKRLGEVYKKFHIGGAGPGKLAKLQQILVSQYQTHQAQASTATPTVMEVDETLPPFDWGEAPDATVFFGRTRELAELKGWAVDDNCRLISIQGIGGVGKTALAVKAAQELEASEHFEFVVWRSLRHSISVRELTGRLTQFILRSRRGYMPESTHDRISSLIECLRQHRCLLVFDRVESILREGDVAGQYRDGFEDYGELFRRLGEENHQSCVILTSSEKPREIALLEGNALPVRGMQLGALSVDEACELFRAKGLQEEKSWGDLVEVYRGNPLALKIAATTIQELFGGKVSEFLKQSTLVFGEIKELVQRQFDRLSELEKSILYWLAIEQQPISLEQLREDIFVPCPQPELLEALASLGRRSLIERSENSALFTLQPVVMEFVSQEFVDCMGAELHDLTRSQKVERLDVFRSHALVAPSQSRKRGKAAPTSLKLMESVKNSVRKTVRNEKQIETQFEKVLEVLEAKFPLEVGYATQNVRHLLESLQADMNDYGKG